jgi:purine-nucleoside phosphorylase
MAIETKTLKEQINDAIQLIRSKTNSHPEIGIVLGTGLGGLTKDIQIETVIEYGDIPHFPLSTTESHHGKLIFGKISGKDIVAMQGRFHYYEGYTMKQITFPIRVMKFLGVKNVLVSNACGSMNPYIKKRSIMLIEDHINLLGDNPLIGKNEDELGLRFPDMSEPYSKELIELTEKIALENNIKVTKGVYVAVQGPNLETRAEYRFLRGIGADVVGMSTVPEVIVARHSKMNVLGFSVITDECYPDALVPADIKDIIEAAEAAEKDLTLLMKKIIEKL